MLILSKVEPSHFAITINYKYILFVQYLAAKDVSKHMYGNIANKMFRSVLHFSEFLVLEVRAR